MKRNPIYKYHQKVTGILAATALLAMSVALYAAGTFTPGEDKFIKEAGAGNAAEVKLAQLAQKQTTNPEVLEFAQHMITDHSKANENLSPIGQQSGITIPPPLTEEQEATANRLAKLSGDAFDKAYVAAMVEDHIQDVAAYKKEDEKVENPDLKNYVTATLPIIEHHLQMAKDLKAKMGGEKP